MDSRSFLSLETPLTPSRQRGLQAVSLKLRQEVIRLIDQAGSGHIGGSMSSLDLLIMLYSLMNISPDNMEAPDRDRIIVSMGHVSPALYSVLAAFGFVSREELFEKYRAKPGVFEGHPNNLAPGVEWCNGCLGQGLSQGCGTAIGLRLRGLNQARVCVLMGDGEQGKGQLQEAMELAGKYRLSRLTAIVDLNGMQSSGATRDVLDVPIAARYRAAGWHVIDIDGHDHEAIRAALQEADLSDRPTCILARTVMGKGIPAIENDWRYHGKLLTKQEAADAIAHMEAQLQALPAPQWPLRSWCGASVSRAVDAAQALDGCDQPLTYQPSDVLDGRKACANALADLAGRNPKGRMCVVDCDLASGLGLDRLPAIAPDVLIECGIQEHNAMSVSGGAAACGLKSFFMDFGMFAIGEPFNQLRVLDQNHIPVKVIASHCGVDVGQDGKSHQFLDYIALSNAFLEAELILPADPNQADRAVRYLASTDRAGVIALPRSVLPVLTDEGGKPLFGDAYRFEYGKADWIRRGGDATIITYGVMVQKAVEAAQLLQREGIGCGVLNLSCPKRMDGEKLRKAAQSGRVLVVEDHNRASGLGAMVAAYLMEHQLHCAFRHLGVEQYGISASPQAQFELQHLTSEDIAAAIRRLYSGKDESHEFTGH